MKAAEVIAFLRKNPDQPFFLRSRDGKDWLDVYLLLIDGNTLLYSIGEDWDIVSVRIPPEEFIERCNKFQWKINNNT